MYYTETDYNELVSDRKYILLSLIDSAIFLGNENIQLWRCDNPIRENHVRKLHIPKYSGPNNPQFPLEEYHDGDLQTKYTRTGYGITGAFNQPLHLRNEWYNEWCLKNNRIEFS